MPVVNPVTSGSTSTETTINSASVTPTISGSLTSKTRNAPPPKAFALTDKLEVSRSANNITLTLDGKAVTFSMERWVQAIASTADTGASPEVRNVVSFILDAKRDWADWLSAEVTQQRESVGPPPG